MEPKILNSDLYVAVIVFIHFLEKSKAYPIIRVLSSIFGPWKVFKPIKLFPKSGKYSFFLYRKHFFQSLNAFSNYGFKYSLGYYPLASQHDNPGSHYQTRHYSTNTVSPFVFFIKIFFIISCERILKGAFKDRVPQLLLFFSSFILFYNNLHES